MMMTAAVHPPHRQKRTMTEGEEEGQGQEVTLPEVDPHPDLAQEASM